MQHPAIDCTYVVQVRQCTDVTSKDMEINAQFEFSIFIVKKFISILRCTMATIAMIPNN